MYRNSGNFRPTNRGGGGNQGTNQSPDYEYCVTKGLEALAQNPPPTANPSLILDKYVGGTRGRTGELELGKRWLIDPFVPKYNKAGNNPVVKKGFDSYRRRWEAMLDQEGAATHRLETVWRLAIHLGRASVVENGSILLQHTLGFPYLPGQSLKGLARAYAETEANIAKPRLDELFGWQDKDKGCEGSLVFFDAIPTHWPELKVDVLTPHFGDWYTSGGKKPPTDDQNPNPVYFLTVAPKEQFLFAVGTVSRLRHDPQAAGLAQEGLELLAGALHDLGAGAKTAAGYGQFTQS